MKNIVFVGCSLDNIRGFPPEVKQETGFQLDKVQHGKNPADWKSMPVIGSGVREIRFSERPGIYRVIYTANFKGSVYVLHAFQKKSQKTNKADLETAKRAYKQIAEKRHE